jgi:hypothetical protein
MYPEGFETDEKSAMKAVPDIKLWDAPLKKKGEKHHLVLCYYHQLLPSYYLSKTLDLYLFLRLLPRCQHRAWKALSLYLFLYHRS